MSLEKTIQELRELLNRCSSDLQKTEKGNRAAAQRVRTGTVRLEKVAKRFRKESVAEEKSGSFKKYKESHKKAKKAGKAGKKKSAKAAPAKKAAKRTAAKRKAAPKKKVTKAPARKFNLKKNANKRQNRPQAW